MFGFGRRQPDVPDNDIVVMPERPQRIYAIGDIHGCYPQLLDLEAQLAEQIAASDENSIVVCLGDLIDRGDNSFGVVEHLISRRSPFERLVLRGNHEEMFLDFLASPSRRHSWLQHGGMETLRSYGLDAETLFNGSRRAVEQKLATHIPQEHVEFLESLPACISFPGLTLVHAGLQEGLPLARQSKRDMTWRRMPVPAFTSPQAFGLLIHGHTPADAPIIEPFRVCIDTGAFATGVLSAAAIGSDNSVQIITTSIAANRNDNP